MRHAQGTIRLHPAIICRWARCKSYLAAMPKEKRRERRRTLHLSHTFDLGVPTDFDDLPN